VNRRAKMVRGSFDRYLEANPDDCHLREDFLDQGARPPRYTRSTSS